ncbi:GNAT family N-acetyltransferase, partial [Vibrio campbellii]
MLLLPYNESLQLEFVMLNCCAKNRAEMNGPHTVSSAKQLFEKILDDENVHSMAVLESTSRDYMGHVFISNLDHEPELGFIFDKAYWGKGLATEALKAFFPKACRELGLHKVKASVNSHH